MPIHEGPSPHAVELRLHRLKILWRLAGRSGGYLQRHPGQRRWDNVQSSHRQRPGVVGLEHEIVAPLAPDLFASKNLPGTPLGHGHDLTEEQSRSRQEQSQRDEWRHQAVKRNPPGLGGQDFSMLCHGVDGEHRGDQSRDRE